jgi:hypothetical protein
VLLPRLFPRALPTRPVLLGHRRAVAVVGTDDRFPAAVLIVLPA